MARLPLAQRHALAAEFTAHDTVEMTCVWLDPCARGPLASANLWVQLLFHARRLGPARAVFGTEVESLRKLYERLGARLLYAGDVKVDGQLRHGWVYVIGEQRFWRALVRLVAESVVRDRPRRRRSDASLAHVGADS
jgi:hypothetical protein